MWAFGHLDSAAVHMAVRIEGSCCFVDKVGVDAVDAEGGWSGCYLDIGSVLVESQTHL